MQVSQNLVQTQNFHPPVLTQGPMPQNLATATRRVGFKKRLYCSTKDSSDDLISEITRANTKILTSFSHLKKAIEEKNTLLGQKKDSLIRASNEF